MGHLPEIGLFGPDCPGGLGTHGIDGLHLIASTNIGRIVMIIIRRIHLPGFSGTTAAFHDAGVRYDPGLYLQTAGLNLVADHSQERPGKILFMQLIAESIDGGIVR